MGKRPITLKDIILQRIFISFLFIFLVLLFINILQSSVLNPIYLLSHLSINKESLEFFKKELLMDKNFLVRTLYDLNLYNLYTRLSTVYGEPVGKVIFKYLPQTLLIITVSVISFILYSLLWYKLVTVLEEKYFHILKRLSSVLVFLYSVPGFYLTSIFNSIIYSFNFPYSGLIFSLITLSVVGFLGSLWVLNTFLSQSVHLKERKFSLICSYLKISPSAERKMRLKIFLFLWLSLFEFFIIFLLTYGDVFIEYILSIKGLGSLFLESLNHRDIYLLKAIIILFIVSTSVINIIFLAVRLKLNPKILQHINSIWKF